MSIETIDYYNNNAWDYAAAASQIDMSPLYAEFLPLLPANAHILDAGCGSGRDANYFKCHGFKVSAFDASSEMAKIASDLLQQSVNVLQFEELDEENQYDGIWCCASLLHVSADNLVSVFNRLQQALKPGALLYVSFKYGDSEREVKGRRFTDMDEILLNTLVAKTDGLNLYKVWLTLDQRADRKDETWLNALLLKDINYSWTRCSNS